MSQVLIDLGTCVTKAGISGESDPQVTLYSCYQPNGAEYLYSSEQMNGMLLFDDFEQINDINALFGFIEHILSKINQQNIDKIQLLFPGRTRRYDCDRVQQFLLDMGKQSKIDQTTPYELYSQGVLKGLLINLSDCGANARLIDGEISQNNVFNGNSGRFITNLLQQQLLELNDVLVRDPMIGFVKDQLSVSVYKASDASSWLKESLLSQSSQMYDTKYDKLQNPETDTLTLPTGEELFYYRNDFDYLGDELGSESPDSKLSIFQILHENIFQQFSRVHIHQIAQNIVLAGGSSTIYNTDSLILRYFHPQTLYKPENTKDASYMRFRGASVISALYDKNEYTQK